MKRLLVGIASIASMLIPLAAVQSATAATTSTAIPSCPRTIAHTITNADNGKTITIVAGSCATLQLDPDLVWTTPKSSSSAVDVFDTETVAPDQRWGLKAVHRGDATITSTGRPNCRPGQVCPMYIELFKVHIHVIGPYAGPDNGDS